MRKALLAGAAALLALSACTTRPARQVTLDILLTSDVHGRWFDASYVDDGIRNSLFAVNTCVDSIRAAAGADHVILLDAGDCLQGDNAAYYYNYVDTLSPHLYPRLAAWMGYDAVVVGNHDIEAGHPVYDRIKREMAEAGIPFLAGNAVRTADRTPYFGDHVILTRDGIRIAILGYTNANIKGWLDERVWSGIDFENLLPLVQEDVESLRAAEHPDLVIVAVHSGTGEGDGSMLESQGKDLFRTLRDVDVLCCSHDHRPMTESSGTMVLLNSGSHARFLSHVSVTLDLDGNGRVTGRHFGDPENIPIDPARADTAMRAAFRDEFEAVRRFTLREVGRLSEDLRTRDAYTGRSLYTDYIHLVTLLSARSCGAEISFAAPLTYNGRVSAGTLIYNDLFTIYPFENQLFVLEMKGQEILDYLEYDYDQWIVSGDPDRLLRIAENDDPRTGSRGWSFENRSYNFDSAAGINYSVDVTQPAGSRIHIRSLADGRAFDPDATYRVAMTSYRANGGGDLLVKGAGIPAEELESRVTARLPELRELIYQFLRQEPLISPALIRRYARTLGDWTFIPVSEAREGMSRDMKRLFPGS